MHYKLENDKILKVTEYSEIEVKQPALILRNNVVIEIGELSDLEIRFEFYKKISSSDNDKYLLIDLKKSNVPIKHTCSFLNHLVSI